MKLTENFSKSEFECKCGCEMPDEVLKNITIVAKQLQVARDTVNRSITINSAYRCPEHNKAIGGVSSSQHILGKASDVVIKGMTPNETFDLLDFLMTEELVIEKGGLGRYDTFTHFDIRGRVARWDNRKNKY